MQINAERNVHMYTRETIILTRRRESVGRHRNITTKRGAFFRSIRQQEADARSLTLATDLARAARIKLEETNSDEPFRR